MNKLILVFTFQLLTGIIQAQWTAQTSGTDNNLYSVCFIDNHNGYVAGDNGTILKTLDGGANWITQESGTSNNLYSVHFTNIDHGCAVGENGTILRTIDGGANWITQESGTDVTFTSLHFADNNTGYIVGYYTVYMGGTYWQVALILKTPNGGVTWTTQLDGPYSGLYSVFFNDSLHGNAVGGGGAALKTIDGGNNWTYQESGGSSYLNAVFFSDMNVGYAGGFNRILKTTDGGAAWAEIYTRNDGDFQSLCFINDNIGYAAGGILWEGQGFIYKTIDAGENWTLEESTNNTLHSVFFCDENTAYTVGDNGYISKFTNASAIEQGGYFSDLEIYPNPSFDLITVEAGSSLLGFTFTIIDLAGREILTGKLTNRKTIVDISQLIAGVYFIQIEHEKNRTIKLIKK